MPGEGAPPLVQRGWGFFNAEALRRGGAEKEEGGRKKEEGGRKKEELRKI